MPWKLVTLHESTKEVQVHYVTSNATTYIFDVAGVPRAESGDPTVKSTALGRLTAGPWGLKLNAVTSVAGIMPDNGRSNPNVQAGVNAFYALSAETPTGSSEAIFLRERDRILFSQTPLYCLDVLWDDTEIQVSSSATDQTEIPESADADFIFESDEVLSKSGVSEAVAVTCPYVEDYNQHIVSTPRLSGNGSIVTETPAVQRFTTVQNVVREDIYESPHSSNGTSTMPCPSGVAPVHEFSAARMVPESAPDSVAAEGNTPLVTEEEIQERLVATQTTIVDLGDADEDNVSEESRAAEPVSRLHGDDSPFLGDERNFDDEETADEELAEKANIDEVISAIPSLPDETMDTGPQFGGDDEEIADEEPVGKANVGRIMDRKASDTTTLSQTARPKTRYGMAVGNNTVSKAMDEKPSDNTKVAETARPRTRSGIAIENKTVDEKHTDTTKVAETAHPLTRSTKATPRKLTSETSDEEPGLDFSSLSQSAGRRTMLHVLIPTPAGLKRTSPVEPPSAASPSIRPAKRAKRVRVVSPDSEDSEPVVDPRRKTPMRRSTRRSLTDAVLLLSSDDEDGFDIAKPKIAFSNSEIPGTTSCTNFIHTCDGRVVDNTTGHWDILCVGTGPIPKSPKLLISVALGIPIVSDDWLKASTKKGVFLPLKDYIPDTLEREIEWEFSMREIWCQPQKDLLKGKSVYFTPALAKQYQPFEDIQAVCKAAGAAQAKALKTSRDVKSSECIILAVEKDDEFALLLADQGHTCFHRDFLTRSILRGKLELESSKFHIQPTRSQEDKEDTTGLRRRKTRR